MNPALKCEPGILSQHKCLVDRRLVDITMPGESWHKPAGGSSTTTWGKKTSRKLERFALANQEFPSEIQWISNHFHPGLASRTLKIKLLIPGAGADGVGSDYDFPDFTWWFLCEPAIHFQGCICWQWCIVHEVHDIPFSGVRSKACRPRLGVKSRLKFDCFCSAMAFCFRLVYPQCNNML